MKVVRHELRNNRLMGWQTDLECACGQPSALPPGAASSVLAVPDALVDEIRQRFPQVRWLETCKHPRRSLSQVLIGRAARGAEVFGVVAPYASERSARKSLTALLRNLVASEARSTFLVAVPARVFERLAQGAGVAPEAPAASIPAARAAGWEPAEQVLVPPELERLFLGHAPDVQRVRQLIMRAASMPEITVLIVGPTGTGKDLAARAIHDYTRLPPAAQGAQPRRPPFVKVDVHTVPPNLFESELFGHLKGSFSGADSSKPGLFQTAHGGTLLLNEIQDLTWEGQGKLRRLIEEKRIRPVGATEEIEFRGRIIAASNQNLDRMVERNLFRRDLYERLRQDCVFILTPALRDHKEDIPLVARELWKRRTSNVAPELPDDVLEELRLHSWPGNVRELDGTLNLLWREYGGRPLRREDVRQVLYLTGGRATLSSPEPSVDSFATFRLDCLRHLIRVGGIIRACKIALRGVVVENRTDLETARSIHAQLHQGLYDDLDLNLRQPLLFHAETAFNAVIDLKKNLRQFMGALAAGPEAIQRYPIDELKRAFEAALSALFAEENHLLRNPH
ncbi:MAG TPA: sigma 54-interacting transcriptional regulator [Candidatus Paceibacterota bacterium]|nr:sigma-54-dependent Fis family transcriptional regulator [Verrucomicrobiota bacterium]HOX04461.1 sigma 54-interacting transcriptional regulator [Verrucomicrobiota bacterium]HRZ47403.1 sigma 54-interacting transcriptional regulator [Candidatus Paceibacterota bacterium]HRZ94211.1 sigma 54-interacting transcriptional regulator [Candidatus Paceibacterota bacterium]